MKSKEEIKVSLREWMVGTIKATHKKACEDGFGYHPSDICFVFRSKLGMKMNEKFVLQSIGTKKRSSEERTKA